MDGEGNPTLRFLLFFIVLVAVLGTAYAFVTVQFADQTQTFARATASITGSILGIFSGSVTCTDRYVSFSGFRVEIIDECTGLLEMVIFLAAVLAFPTTWRKKLIGIAGGLPAIYVFNVMRMIFLLIAGASSKSLFEFMHLYFWQVTLILIIATIWLGWLYLVVLREKKSTLAVSR